MAERLARRVALIGWDAADWKLIHPLLDAGLMPNLQRLVERGSMGNIASLEPCMPAMLWTSVATGKTADRHGILAPIEPDPVTAGARPVSSTSRKVKALWNILCQSGLRSVVVNWSASHPAEPLRGACVSDFFPKATAPHGAHWELPPDCVHPEPLSGALADLRVHPGDLTGDDLLPFIPELARIDQQRDRRPLMLAGMLAETITAHAAATWLMENQDWDFLAVRYPTLHHAGQAFMQYCPPSMEAVAPDDFEIYQHVVQGMYCFHDMMLGRLAALAGPDAAIILASDHGLHRDPPRAETPLFEAPHNWRRKHGAFCIAGPGIRQDEMIYGATLLDIAPTVLALLGLPAGEDMPGRVLAEAFESPVAGERIRSWEMPAPSADTPDTAAMLRDLEALGYVDPAAANQGAGNAGLQQEFNLACVLLNVGRPAEALPLLERAAREHPHDAAIQLYLAQSYYETGRFEDCLKIAAAVLATNKIGAEADLLQANISLAEGNTGEALSRLLAAAESGGPAVPIQCLVGRVFLTLERWADAERAFRNAIETDSDAADAHAGLAQALAGSGDFERAAEAAADALGLRFDLPEAHFTLGVALARAGRPDRAIQAFETCLKLRPGLAPAREWLANLRQEEAPRDHARIGR